MKPNLPIPASRTFLAALLAVAACSGCALDRLPRIDPSGERFLVWPGSQPVVGPVATPGSSPVIASGQPLVAPPNANLTAPPVLSSGSSGNGRLCPLCPLCPLGGLLDGPAVIGPVAGQPLVEPPTDRVTLTPGRVLAPVGTEVVLKAGVCGKDGYLLTNRRIEWMLGQEGAGQFAKIGEEGEMDMGRLPWSRPDKIDNHYAVGYTAPFYTCLHRGTVNPADDLQVQKGEAWVTVTSASEGTSYITAYAPKVENWNARRAQATIYWVDAQWQLPPSAMVAAGQPHTLVTTITRQTDGAPIAGWIVRYEVADASGAQLGYQAGQTAEVTTDNRGRASVEVTPTDSNPGTTAVRVTIVRPEQAGVAASPRLDIGQGQAQITWSNTAPGTQPLFPPVGPPTTIPTEPTPRPTLPPEQPTGPREPPIGIQEPPAGRPSLRIRVERAAQGEIKVQDRVVYNVKLENIGTGVARNVGFKVRYDEGLINPQDASGLREIQLENIGDLEANGGSVDTQLSFDVLTAGEHYFDATLTADSASQAFEHVEFTAVEDRPPAPTVTFEIGASPDRRVEVGQEVKVSVTIRNTGQTDAQGLQLTVNPDARFMRVEETSRDIASVSTPTDDGGVLVRLPTLPAGQSRQHLFTLSTRQATDIGLPAQVRASLTDPSRSVNEFREATVEIIPALNPAPTGPLTVTVRSQDNPARLRTSSSLTVTVQNNGQQPLQGVQLQIAMPAGLSPRPAVAQTPLGTGLIAQEGVLTVNPPIAQLAPGATEQVVLPYDAIQQGSHTVNVRSTWQGAATWVTGQGPITVTP